MEKKYHPEDLAGRMFKDIILILEKSVKYIRKKKCLRYKNKHDEILCGLLLWGKNAKDHVIYLNSSKNANKNRDELAKSLLHEALHILFHTNDNTIIKPYENICWDCLNIEQKRIIKSYLPKKEVKINP